MKTLLIAVSVWFASCGLIVGANTHTLQEVMAEQVQKARHEEAVKWIVKFTPRQLSDISI